MSTRYGYAGSTSKQDLRGKVIGVRSRVSPYLYEISFKVIAQAASWPPGESRKGGRSLRNGSVVLESLIGKHQSSVSFLSIEEGLDNGSLVLEED